MAGSLTDVKSTLRELESCASTWPASSQKFPRTSRTKLTKKKPVYVSGPAMAKHQKQLWSDPL